MAGQVVQITINVTDGNAAEAVQQVVAQLNAIGPAGEAAGAQGGAGLDQVGERALSARENVRLLSEEMGVHVPRAMQSVIANNQMLMGAIGALGPAMIGIGAVDILMHVGEAVVGAYEKYVELKEVLVESAAVAKSFGDSAAAAMQRASEATEQYIRITQGAQAADQFKLNRLQSTSIPIPQYQTDDYKKLPDKVKGDFEKLTGESIMPKDMDATIQKVKDYEGELRKALITVQAAKQPGVLGGPYSEPQLQEMTKLGESIKIGDSLIADLTARQNSYTAQVKENQAQIDQDAKAKSDAAIARQKQEQSEIIQLQNQARNAGLEGNALRAAQEEEEIAAITRKYREGEISKQAAAAETAAVQARFTAQAEKLQEQLDEQTRHLADEAAQAGLKGVPLLAAQLKTQLDAIDAAEKKAVGPGGQETMQQANDYQSQRDSARQMNFQKGTEEQTAYNEKIRSLMESSDDQELQGYARINAGVQKHLEELLAADQAYYGSAGAANAAYSAQAVRVEADADRERQMLHHKTMEEIAKEEQQTARDLLPGWQQAIAKIEDMYTDRLAKIQQDVKTHVMTEEEGAAATVAAWNQANAQMQKSAEETRDKLAGGLQSLFEHPEKFFEERAMKSAYQMMANQMMPMMEGGGPMGGAMQYMFGMGPNMSTSRNPMTDMHSILGGGAASSTMSNPSMMQFSQGSTLIQSSGQTFMQAVSQFQSAVTRVGAGGAGGVGGGAGGASIHGMAGASNTGMSGGSAGLAATGSLPSTAAGMASMGLPAASPALRMPAGGYPSMGGAGNQYTDASSLTGIGDSSSLSSGVDLPAAEPPLAMPAGGYPDMPENSYPTVDASTLTGTGSSSSQSGMSFSPTAQQGMNAAGGAISGAIGMYSAYESSNPMAGALSGMMAGMAIGSMFGPIGAGVGAVVGGVAGAVAGMMGGAGKKQAESLDYNTIQPELKEELQNYESGASGYESSATDLSNMLTSARNQTNAWGSGARRYFQSNIEPEINTVLLQLQKQQSAGRSGITFGAAQYHTGGAIGDFGDLATSDTEGFIHAMKNEFVVNPTAAAAHAPILSAMNNGVNFGYSSQVQPRMPASSGGGGGTIHIQAMDSKSVATWAKTGGGKMLMAAMNQAQSQYSGIGRG